MNLSPSAQKVQDALAAHGLELQVIELPASTRTAAEAAAAIGCQVAQIAKSIIFATRNTQQAILIIASGTNRVNESIIEREVNEPLEKAAPDFVKEQAGFVIGGVPVIGHIKSLITFIDEDLLQYPELWAAAGTPHAVFRLTPTDLCKITDGKVIALKK
jgi:prolyl-tRNA editing enzyme YbaK/EbsC (Cys-tRNA(Pro) deacylase)